MSKRIFNPGLGREFYFFGRFRSLIAARKQERRYPGSFIVVKKGQYYVVKRRERKNPSMLPTPRISRYSQFRVNRQNPRKGTVIYGRILKIFAQKTSGPYKGQRFVHTFKRGAIMTGMPDGSLRISHP